MRIKPSRKTYIVRIKLPGTTKDLALVEVANAFNKADAIIRLHASLQFNAERKP